MSFGGFPNPFSSSSSSSSSSQPSSQQSQLPTSTTSPSESAAIRSRIENTFTTSNNVQNAKYLISKVNETCFAHCVPVPGSSLSSKEQSCLSSCMEKYIEAWNVTSRTYIGRLQREGVQGVGNTLGGGGGNDRELF